MVLRFRNNVTIHKLSIGAILAATVAAALLMSAHRTVTAASVSSAADAFQHSKSEILKLNPVTTLTASTFGRPPMTDWPWVRMNLPATAEPAQLAAEIADLHRFGVAGVEVGQGAYPNDLQLTALLTAANRLGVKVSLSHGPTVAPTGYSIDDEHARKTLDVNPVTVEAGSSIDLQLQPPAREAGNFPGARQPPHSRRTALVAVLAYRCALAPCAESGVVQLDRASIVDLTSSVTSTDTAGYAGGTTTGKLLWTAPVSPVGSQWLVISFWARGIYAQPDPFTKAGHEQLIRGMETAWTPRIKQLLKKNAGDLFYDSHSVDRGSPDESWSNGIGQEFEARFGRSLQPELAALLSDRFSFSDGSDVRVRADFVELRGDLWLRNHIEPLTAWAHTYNQRLRLQPEGELQPHIAITDQVKAAYALDRPEHESLFVADEVDNYLPIASANHMRGNPWYSTECCAAVEKNYLQTFQDLVIRMHRSFAGGITKLVYHVYPYRDAPDAKWPGYHNFPAAGFSNAWGPRNPFWVDAKIYNEYLARNQQVLTQGDAKVDVAVYMQNYLYPAPFRVKDGFRIWRDTKLQEAGYSRDYINPSVLDLPSAVVTDGRLALDGPAYKALIINSELQPAKEPLKTAMPITVAERILGFARSGLPVIVVGAPPSQTPGNTPADDARLRAIVDQLLAEKSVRRVAHESDVPDVLRAAGIEPAARPDQPSPLLSVRRRDESRKVDYYFIHNQGVVSPPGEPSNIFEPATGAQVERTIYLEGRGKPYLLDAWRGIIVPIADYVTNNGRVGVKVRIAPDDAMLLALTETPGVFGSERASRSNLVAAAVTDTLPAPLNLGAQRWRLTLEEWQPANNYATTFGTAAAETRKTTRSVDLDAVSSWSAVPGMESASGIGTYTTEFDLPASWSNQYGATLRLGEVLDTFVVTLNGRVLRVNQISGESDVSDALKAGRNTLTVRVASTINNRLVALDEAAAKRGIVQKYGLIGPVALIPYRKMN